MEQIEQENIKYTKEYTQSMRASTASISRRARMHQVNQDIYDMQEKSFQQFFNEQYIPIHYKASNEQQKQLPNIPNKNISSNPIQLNPITQNIKKESNIDSSQHINMQSKKNQHKNSKLQTQINIFQIVDFKQTYKQFIQRHQPIYINIAQLHQKYIFLIDSYHRYIQFKQAKDWVNVTDFMVSIRKKHFYCFLKQQDVKSYINSQEGTYEVVQYIAIVSKFKVNIKLKNIYTPAPQVDQYIGKGTFGCVVKENINGKIRASKRSFFHSVTEDKQKYCSKKEIIDDVVRQCAIFKLMACLGYGPALAESKDFDILCYDDCVSFSMELCLSVKDAFKKLQLSHRNFILKFKSDIKECLLGMHNIKIVHRDIKPRNCLYSTEHNKFVLADFGISTPIVEDYTQKTYVPYAGTDGYMTQQLKQIKNMRNGCGYINLYEEDMHAYNVTISQICYKDFENKSSEKHYQLKLSESPFQTFNKLNSLIPSKETEGQMVEMLCKMGSKDEIISCLKRVSHFERRMNIINLVQKRLQVSQFNKLKNVQLYAEEQCHKFYARPLIDQIHQEFKMRILGCSDDINGYWKKQIYNLNRTDKLKKAEILQKYAQLQRYKYISFDSPQEIRYLSGIRIPHSHSIHAYKSILQSRDLLSSDSKSQSWLSTAKIYCQLIWANRFVHKILIQKNNADVQLLRKLFDNNMNGPRRTREEALLQCIIFMWEEKYENALKLFNLYIQKYQQTEQIFVDIRSLFEACWAQANYTKAYEMLNKEEVLRKKCGRINEQEVVVLQYCKLICLSSQQENNNAAKQGIQIFDSLKQTGESILRTFLIHLKVYFLIQLHRYQEAVWLIYQSKPLFDKYVSRASIRYAQISDNLRLALVKLGKYQQAISLINPIIYGMKQNTSKQGLQVHKTMHDLCRLYVSIGNYKTAQEQIETNDNRVNKMQEDTTKQRKIYQVLCLKALNLLEKGELSEINNILNKCKIIYINLSNQENKLIEQTHQLLFAKYFSRERQFREAQQILKQISTLKEINEEFKILIILQSLEILSLQKQFNSQYSQLLTQFDEVYSKFGPDYSLLVSALIFKAEYLLNAKQQDFGEFHCRECIKMLEYKQSPQLGKVYSILAQIYHVRGSDQCYKYKQLADSIFSLQNSWLGLQQQSRLLAITDQPLQKY